MVRREPRWEYGSESLPNSYPFGLRASPRGCRTHREQTLTSSAGSDTVFPLTVIQCKEPRVHVPCTALAGWLLVLKKCHSAHPLMGSIQLGVSGKTRPWEAGTEYCLVSDTWKLTKPVRKVEFNIAAGRFGAVVAASLQFL